MPNTHRTPSTRRRGRLLLAACLVAAGGLLTLVQAPWAQQDDAVVYRVPIEGIIEMGLAPFVERSLSEASEAGARAVVLDIDTPGGRVDAAQRITDAVRDSEVPVYAYINRRAISAGAMISLSTQGIYMRPGSAMGASTPVTGEGETASEKMVSVMRSEFRTMADARGLDPRIAEAMVDENVEVEGISPAGQLLTLSTSEAVSVGFAEEVEDWDALMASVDASGARVVDMRTNWAERLVRFLTHPVVSPFLLSIGFLGLLIEIKTPAFGLAGMAGLTSLGLFFGSHLLIGLAGMEVVLLLAAGIVLVLVELLVIPGTMVAGVLGIAAILGAVFMSMIGRLPTSGDVLVALNVMAASALLVGIATWQLFKRLPKDRRGRHLFLETATGRAEGYSSSKVRNELAGTEGVTLTDLRPAGTARFEDENVDVVSDGPWIQSGSRVKVLRSEGYRHVVREVSAPAKTH